VPARKFGPYFDGLGNPVASADQARFCVNVRVSPLFTNAMGRTGNGVVRTEIRVYWLRDGATPLGPFCAEEPAVLAALGNRPDLYQIVYQTAGVRQHSQI
jgi:hypothetical protein